MNTKNNKRRRASVEAIERSFIELLQTREIKEITVSDICKQTGLNRSTFYANFLDIYDLADKLRHQLEEAFASYFPQDDRHSYEDGDGALRMFTHISENQLFYQTYFKLSYDETQAVMIYDLARAERDFHSKHVEYHIEFFRAGLNAMIKRWLNSGCRETPAEMAAILVAEYQGR